MAVTSVRFPSVHWAGGNPHRRLLLTALVLFFAGYLLGAAKPAWAHAELIGSTPANGSRLATAPAEVRLRFSERVNAVRDGVTVLDSSGATRARGTPQPVPNNEVTLTLPGGLPDGVYTVLWRVVSADSHPIHCAFVFSLGNAVAASVPGGAQSDVDSGLASVFWLIRWLGYAGLALLAGGVCLLVLCWPAGWASRRARRIIAGGWVTSVICAWAALFLQGPYSQGGTLAGISDLALVSATLSSDYGAFMLARLGLLLAGGLLLLALTSTNPLWTKIHPLLGWTTALLLGVALPATWIGTGHAAAGNLVTMAVDTVHLVAMSAWLGGLALLLAALLTRATIPSMDAAKTLTRFSPIAAPCIADLVLTSVYQAWRGVGSIDALAGSAYGRLLLFKVAGIAMLLWLGALSNSAMRRGYAGAADGTQPLRGRAARDAAHQEQRARTGLRRSVGLETITAVAILGLTSVLVSTPPGSRPAAPLTAGHVIETDLSLPDGGKVNVMLGPAQVGASLLTLSVHDRAGTDWDVPEVSASLTLPAQRIGPLPVALTRQQPGRYISTSLSLPVAGGWRLAISVRTSDFDQHTVEADVPVR